MREALMPIIWPAASGASCRCDQTRSDEYGVDGAVSPAADRNCRGSSARRTGWTQRPRAGRGEVVAGVMFRSPSRMFTTRVRNNHDGGAPEMARMDRADSLGESRMLA